MDNSIPSNSSSTKPSLWSRILHVVVTSFEIVVIFLLFVLYMLWGAADLQKMLVHGSRQSGPVLSGEEIVSFDGKA
jgi:hypothetical protein